jgi:hypothetical protein
VIDSDRSWCGVIPSLVLSLVHSLDHSLGHSLGHGPRPLGAGIAAAGLNPERPEFIAELRRSLVLLGLDCKLEFSPDALQSFESLLQGGIGPWIRLNFARVLRAFACMGDAALVGSLQQRCE